VTDACGNSSAQDQTIMLKDTTAPVVTAPADQTVECDGVGNSAALTTWKSGATAMDTCSAASTPTYVEESNTAGCGATRVIKAHWTSSDACGNTGLSASRTFTIQDTTLPVFTFCPGNIITNTGPGRITCDQVVTWQAPTASDNCSAVIITQTMGLASGSAFPKGTTTNEYTAIDACGKTSKCTFTVTVLDTTPPIVLCKPATLHLDSTGLCPLAAAAVDGGCSDNCTATASLIRQVSKSSFSCSDIGTNTVKLMVTDGSGNSATGLATVVVVDQIPPSVPPTPCSPDKFGTLGSTPVPDFTAGVVASDNCQFSLSQSPPAGTTGLPAGTNLITITATDTSTNTASCQARFIVQYVGSGTCGGVATHSILQPINTDGSSVFKQGSTVPAKFRVCDALGNSIGTPGIVTNFRLVKTVNGTVVSQVNETVDSTTPDNTFRYDPSGQQWIFNISTKSLPKNVTYYYEVDLNDGSMILFSFGLK
jgi:hypothetical protein